MLSNIVEYGYIDMLRIFETKVHGHKNMSQLSDGLCWQVISYWNKGPSITNMQSSKTALISQNRF